MAYQKDIDAMRGMMSDVLGRWQRPPSRALGSLPIRCTRCCSRTVKAFGDICPECEARYAAREAYTGPIADGPCGECHLQPGECCDICGKRNEAEAPVQPQSPASAVGRTR